MFSVYVLTSEDHVLDAQKAFVSLNIINILNWTGALLPMEISFAVQVTGLNNLTASVCVCVSVCLSVCLSVSVFIYQM